VIGPKKKKRKKKKKKSSRGVLLCVQASDRQKKIGRQLALVASMGEVQRAYIAEGGRKKEKKSNCFFLLPGGCPPVFLTGLVGREIKGKVYRGGGGPPAGRRKEGRVLQSFANLK